MYVHVCVFICVHNRNLNVHTRRDQRLISNVFPTTLIFETGSLMEPRVYQVIYTGRPVSSVSASLVLGFQAHTAMPAFFFFNLEAGDPNSGPPAYLASTLPTDCLLNPTQISELSSVDGIKSSEVELAGTMSFPSSP